MNRSASVHPKDKRDQILPCTLNLDGQRKERYTYRHWIF